MRFEGDDGVADADCLRALAAASFLAEAGELAAFLGDMTLCNAAAFLALLVFTVALDGDLGVKALFFLLGVRGGDLRTMAYLEVSGYSQRNERSPRVKTSLWRITCAMDRLILPPFTIVATDDKEVRATCLFSFTLILQCSPATAGS